MSFLILVNNSDDDVYISRFSQYNLSIFAKHERNGILIMQTSFSDGMDITLKFQVRQRHFFDRLV